MEPDLVIAFLLGGVSSLLLDRALHIAVDARWMLHRRAIRVRRDQ